MGIAREIARLRPNSSGLLPNANIEAMAASKLTGQVPDANAPSGSVIQVVSVTKRDTFSTNSAGDTAITGLSASITPLSTSSKIFIMFDVNYDSTRGNSGGGFRIYRNGSHLTASSGNTDGNRYTVSADFGANANADQSGMHRSGTYLDSPSTTSSTTYQIIINQDSSFSTFINRARADANDTDDGRMASSITLMEIAA